ncbi:MAG: sigma-70 family RNA polymerase sigma factor [Chlorobi bacterium]|nr:sigma-70 family RNA polymerase sigma factor [Chlorobiota bacterium]
MINEEDDICLIHHKPEELVCKYRPKIEFLVMNHLIIPGYFKRQEKEDLVQEVSTGLLDNLKNILKSYNGRSKFQPFFVQVIKNKCFEIRRNSYIRETVETIDKNSYKPGYRKEKIFRKKHASVELKKNTVSEKQPGFENTDIAVILKSEIEFLEFLLRHFQDRCPRMTICLKILTGYSVSLEELKQYCKGCAPRVYEKLLGFSNCTDKHTKEQCYQSLTDFFNLCDGRNNNKEAIRKEIIYFLKEIIYHLNSPPEHGNYNQKNILELFSWYFGEKNNSKTE